MAEKAVLDLLYIAEAANKALSTSLFVKPGTGRYSVLATDEEWSGQNDRYRLGEPSREQLSKMKRRYITNATFVKFDYIRMGRNEEPVVSFIIGMHGGRFVKWQKVIDTYGDYCGYVDTSFTWYSSLEEAVSSLHEQYKLEYLKKITGFRVN